MTFNPAFPLELLNGCGVIVDGAFLLWGVWYLWRETGRRHLTFWQWILALPASMNLVVAVLVHDGGVWIRSLVIWLWRVTGAGPFTMAQLLALAAGGALIVVGGLCKIRAVTKPAYGDWPWLGCLYLVMLFLAGSLLTR